MKSETPRQYKDADGNPISLWRLVQKEPQWAMNQILHRDKLELELTAAQQALAESQKREAGLLHFIEDTERRAKIFMMNGSFTMFKNEHDQLKSKALTSPPTSVVPWEVVQRLIDKAPTNTHYKSCTCSWCRKIELYNSALSELQSYAQQPKEKQAEAKGGGK